MNTTKTTREDRLKRAGFIPWTGKRPEEQRGFNLEYLLGRGRIIATRPQKRA